VSTLQVVNFAAEPKELQTNYLYLCLLNLRVHLPVLPFHHQINWCQQLVLAVLLQLQNYQRVLLHWLVELQTSHHLLMAEIGQQFLQTMTTAMLAMAEQLPQREHYLLMEHLVRQIKKCLNYIY